MPQSPQHQQLPQEQQQQQQRLYSFIPEVFTPKDTQRLNTTTSTTIPHVALEPISTIRQSNRGNKKQMMHEDINHNCNHIIQFDSTASPSSEDEETGSPNSKIVCHLSKEQIQRQFMYPQPEAAKRLGVSLSTLKRRFYETHGNSMRWPYTGIKKILKKRTLHHIMNSKNKPTKQLDPHTVHMLKRAFAGQL